MFQCGVVTSALSRTSRRSDCNGIRRGSPPSRPKCGGLVGVANANRLWSRAPTACLFTSFESLVYFARSEALITFERCQINSLFGLYFVFSRSTLNWHSRRSLRKCQMNGKDAVKGHPQLSNINGSRPRQRSLICWSISPDVIQYYIDRVSAHSRRVTRTRTRMLWMKELVAHRHSHQMRELQHPSHTAHRTGPHSHTQSAKFFAPHTPPRVRVLWAFIECSFDRKCFSFEFSFTPSAHKYFRMWDCMLYRPVHRARKQQPAISV